jgi:PKHD-type hydroxylase
MDHGAWHDRGPFVLHELVPAELCDQLLDAFWAAESRPRSYQGVVDASQRKCDYAEVPVPLAIQVTAVVAEHVDELFGVRSEPVARQPLLIYRYRLGIGFVTHHDEVTDVEVERSCHNGQPVIGGDLTTILFLNDPREYVGGALYFEAPPLELRPSRGTVVTFPATRQFMHGVRPIEQGERYTLLGRRTVVAVRTPSPTPW